LESGFFIKKTPTEQKEGEEVEPAGGETGGPRCLAEDYKAAQSSIISVESIIPQIKHDSKIFFSEKNGVTVQAFSGPGYE